MSSFFHVLEACISLTLNYQALYFAQLIIFQGGGRFQRSIDDCDVRAFPAQSARLIVRASYADTAVENKSLIYVKYSNKSKVI